MTKFCRLSLLSGLLLAGCQQAEQPAPAKKQPETVGVVRVQSSVAASTKPLPGQLLPYETVDVFPKTQGFITTMLVDRGARVAKGQVLVRLSAPELGAQRDQAAGVLRAAQAKAATDQATYARLANAARTPGVVAGNDVDIARGMAQADAAQVASARDALRSVAVQEGYLVIRAPFAGVVTDRNLHPGALVGPSLANGAAKPILTLANVDRLRLVVPVPAADAQVMTVGQKATFTTPGSPGRKFEAPIARIADALDERSRTMSVELDVANKDHLQTAGSFVTVQWPIHRRAPTLQVPQTAVANDQQRQFVILVRNGRTKWVDVTTGMTADGKTEVFGDLQAGDLVVKRGTDALRDGAQVKAVPAPKDEPKP